MRDERLQMAVRKLAAARTERDQLRLVRGWLTACEREQKQEGPCWKFIRYDRVEDADPEGFNAGGESVEDWCTVCRLRHPVYLAYRSAGRAYSGAAAAFWPTVRAMQSWCAL